MSLQNTRILYQGCSFPLLSEKAIAEFLDEDQSTYTSDEDRSARVIWVNGWMDGLVDGYIYMEEREGGRGGEGRGRKFTYVCICVSVIFF